MQSENITGAAIASMIQSSNSPRRSTVSSIPQAKLRPANIQCTHTTVTRLFTTEFRCGSCLRVAPLGWLYRCIQDRELISYDYLERNTGDKFDNLSDLFRLPSTPPKRHPIARLDRMAFLDEISDEQLKTYSQEQINLILKQRAKVLDTAFQSSRDSNSFSSKSFYNIPLTPVKDSSTSVASQSSPGKLLDRPFLPLRGGECQFKCCQYCRPNLVERSYLSLNGIADGDVPASAILGFGFHLNEKRPVALATHVKNLGLRPSPAPRKNKPATPTSEMNYKKVPPTQNRLSKVFNRRNTMQGLGLFSPTVSSSSIIAEPTEATSSNVHTHGNAHSVEQGFTAISMGKFLAPDLTSNNAYLSQVQNHTPPSVQNLQTTFQHQSANGELFTKPEAKQEKINRALATSGGMDIETLVRQVTGTGVGKYEKETLLEMNMREKDELVTVVGVQAVEPGMDISDVITHF